jgi:hypothetical protein
MIYRLADVSRQQGDRADVREIFRFSNWSPEDNLLTTPLLFALYLKPLRHDPRPQAAHLRSHTVRSHGA